MPSSYEASSENSSQTFDIYLHNSTPTIIYLLIGKLGSCSLFVQHVSKCLETRSIASNATKDRTRSLLGQALVL